MIYLRVSDTTASYIARLNYGSSVRAKLLLKQGSGQYTIQQTLRLSFFFSLLVNFWLTEILSLNLFVFLVLSRKYFLSGSIKRITSCCGQHIHHHFWPFYSCLISSIPSSKKWSFFIFKTRCCSSIVSFNNSTRNSNFFNHISN